MRDTHSTPFLRRAWGVTREHPYVQAAAAPLAALSVLLLASVAYEDGPGVVRLGLVALLAVAVIWLFERVLGTRELENRQARQLLEQSAQLQDQAVELDAQTRALELHLQAQSRSERRYRVLFESVQDGILLVGHDRRIAAANRSAMRILGLTEEQLLGRVHADPAWRFVREDGTPFPVSQLPASIALRSGETQQNVLMGVARPDGTRRWVVTNAIARDDVEDSGRVVIVGFSDITELFESRRSLRETEAQLRQAQKMEAVGQLAGGIAHDFNNLLTVITAFTELLSLDIQSDSPRRADLNEISKASARAAELTRQLLAFSRKQVLRPRRLNVNEVVESMGRMIGRLIGEDIEVVTRLAPDVADVFADPGQLEQVIANLAVNSRDAMPDGGVFVVETSNVEIDVPLQLGDDVFVPLGSYVRLLVSDTGIGMNASVRERIFEPFFTTKDPGKGTGLGLSTVYGIVKQSGGHIWVESVPGAGARFELYFPRADQASTPDGMRATGEHALPTGGGVILLVEDEDSVRTATRRILQRAGYTVLEAATPMQALSLARSPDHRIDLLLTDLVMPGRRGTDLAHDVLTLQPGARLMVMSGYSEVSSASDWSLPADVTFLEKPFSARSLTSTVAQLLGDTAGKG